MERLLASNECSFASLDPEDYPISQMRQGTDCFSYDDDPSPKGNEGVTFSVHQAKLFSALPRLAAEEQDHPGVAAQRLRRLSARTCEVLFGLVLLDAKVFQPSPSSDALAAFAFCKRFRGEEPLLARLRSTVLEGNVLEPTGRYGLWSFALGDELKEPELLQAGAVASLRLPDLANHIGKYSSDFLCSAPAATALVTLHERRIETASTILEQCKLHPPRLCKCSHFPLLVQRWSAYIKKNRHSLTPAFEPRHLLAFLWIEHEKIPDDPCSAIECEQCRMCVEAAVKDLETLWDVPATVEPDWWRQDSG